MSENFRANGRQTLLTEILSFYPPHHNPQTFNANAKKHYVSISLHCWEMEMVAKMSEPLNWSQWMVQSLQIELGELSEIKGHSHTGQGYLPDTVECTQVQDN